MAFMYLGDDLVTIIKDITEASEMTEENIIYRYLGGEEGYLNGKLYYWTGSTYEPIGTGSGGGGGDTTASVLTLANTSGWLIKTIPQDSDCSISFTWSSTLDDIVTGAGTLKVTVNRNTVISKSISQGDVSISVGSYLVSGSNSIRVVVSDSYNTTRYLNFTVTVLSTYITSTFDYAMTYSGAISFPYIVTGTGVKTVHFILDGTEYATAEVTKSGSQSTQTIPMQPHGAHTFETYFTTTVEGSEVESNHLYYDIMFVEEGNDTPIIASNYKATEVQQFALISIPYYVYNPASLTASVQIIANGAIISEITVDRTEQIAEYRATATGDLNIQITCGETVKEFLITITESEADIYAETDDLVLYLTSTGRSNSESTRDVWEYEDIAVTFSDFNWTSDGWQKDDDGNTVMRVAGDGRISIPYQIFAKDFRTTGKTIEFEIATRNVLDYDAEVITCYSGARGFKLTAQEAILKSEQSEIFSQYKEDDHIRVSFVVEKRSENRLIYIYINGIMSGAVQYPDNDDFSQITPVNITIGSNYCTTDIYNIRIYDNNLTRTQILANWIADTQDVDEMLARYERNNIFDEYGSIVIDKLPGDLPYMVMTAPTLPQYKGDKKTTAVVFTDPSGEFVGYSAEGASANVQGTSSQYYPRKNYKISYKKGFIINGETTKAYPLRKGAIPTNEFTYKADVASSEGANNVELARIYNDTCPDLTPPQKEDSSVRQTIDGFPIVIFHNNGVSTNFIGKYNFNNDKGTPEVYGFSDGDESWEIKNNTSDRVLFKTADFSDDDWLNDFEGSYPEDNDDSTKLAAMCQWVASTNGNSAKFKSELADWFSVDSCLYYYLFTELFLMVDSRAKNAFPTYWAADGKWRWRLYDADTALGINNEGALVFDYSLEDIDHLASGANIFNGQESVFWVNIREAYQDELAAMYKQVRSNGILSYDVVEGRFEEHQSKWGEAIFNEDAQFKYIDPLINNGEGTYLSMLQGSKKEQRRWWMYNRFRYIDSKYNAGDALTDYIVVRGYAKSDITVTPYADVYATIKYGSYLVQTRAYRDNAYTLACPLDEINDTEIMIFSASQLSQIGDLSPLKVGYADFSKGIRLSEIKIGDESSSYSNGNLKELTLGNNVLLKTLDVRNCPSLATAVNLSGCTGIEEVYFDGTAITGVDLPNGGLLKVLHLPDTVTNLTIRNQGLITDFTLTNYANITTLRLENVSSAVNSFAILNSIQAGSRVRLIGFYWTAESVSDIYTILDKLDTMRGLDETGGNMDKAQVSGTIFIDTITGTDYAAVKDRYSGITIAYNHISAILKYYTYDGSTLLQTETVLDKANGTYTGKPSRAADARYTYTFAGWSTVPGANAEDDALSAVELDRNVYAAYTAEGVKYTVKFYNGTTLLQTVNDVLYEGTAKYTGETPVYSGDEDFGDFTGWSPSPVGITGNTSCYAQFVDNRSKTRLLLTKKITSVDDDDETITSIGQYAFYYCTKLTSISLPAATSISDYAFYNCKALTSVSLPAATSIGHSAFYYCSALTSVSLPVATRIGHYAFYDCGALTEISLPVATSIGSYALFRCKALTSISLPAATSISASAFFNCTALTSVSLPVATIIGNYAFQNCTALTDLYLNNTTMVTLADVSTFAAVGTTVNVHVPSDLISTYQANSVWRGVTGATLNFVALEG